MPEIAAGIVISWYADRGFGFARSDDGGEIFLGRSELLRAGIQNLQIGQRLSFRLRPDNYGKSLRATDVRFISEPTA
jgi:cold shock CspA family protein